MKSHEGNCRREAKNGNEETREVPRKGVGRREPKPRKTKEGQKRKVTSLTLGTGGKRLWLLRSRPDQVDRPSMRGGPSRRILASLAVQRDCSCVETRFMGLARGLLYPLPVPPDRPRSEIESSVTLPPA
ncbi:protein of unknown function [Paraburkholderia kururiensis]